MQQRAVVGHQQQLGCLIMAGDRCGAAIAMPLRQRPTGQLIDLQRPLNALVVVGVQLCGSSRVDRRQFSMQRRPTALRCALAQLQAQLVEDGALPAIVRLLKDKSTAPAANRLLASFDECFEDAIAVASK